MKKKKSYLFQFAISRANKSHGVAAVVVRRHWGHAIIFVDEEGGALNGAGSPQRLVEVLTTEIIVYLQRLEGRRKNNNHTRGNKNVQNSILLLSVHFIAFILSVTWDLVVFIVQPRCLHYYMFYLVGFFWISTPTASYSTIWIISLFCWRVQSKGRRSRRKEQEIKLNKSPGLDQAQYIKRFSNFQGHPSK